MYMQKHRIYNKKFKYNKTRFVTYQYWRTVADLGFEFFLKLRHFLTRVSAQSEKIWFQNNQKKKTWKRD